MRSDGRERQSERVMVNERQGRGERAREEEAEQGERWEE